MTRPTSSSSTQLRPSSAASARAARVDTMSPRRPSTPRLLHTTEIFSLVSASTCGQAPWCGGEKGTGLRRPLVLGMTQASGTAQALFVPHTWNMYHEQQPFRLSNMSA
eukprot:363452-Chlamydomonas_euryale.AAC.4